MIIMIVLLWNQLLFASPTDPDPRVNVPSKSEVNAPPEDTRPLDEMGITPAGPKAVTHNADFFYPYSSALSVSLGPNFHIATGDYTPTQVHPLINLGYLWSSQTRFHLESGLEILDNNTGRFFTGGRWISLITDVTRPYWSIGVGMWLKPEYQLATFVRWQNYFFRAAGGAEWSFSQSISLKAELFSGMAMDATFFLGATLGLSFGAN